MALLAAAFLLLGYGIFGFDRGGAKTSAACDIGLIALLVSLVLLVRSGWRGSPASWLAAAAGVFIGTWVLYELLRQGPCLTVASGIPLMICNVIPFRDTAAPELSVIAALIVLVAGWLRLRHLAGSRRPDLI